MSGRPLSYEQVLCRLPKLEIHDLPSDDFNTNFDLKDNTDHTQLLVKVSLEYSQNGGRSAPLDLLLYDSLCWDCSIDGCQANTKENKCFFASGTSALQIFRIGRTIATRVSPDDAYTCTLPKDSGSCDNKIFRYYYNAIEVGKCVLKYAFASSSSNYCRDVVNYSFMEDAKAMATISSVKFNVFRNVEMSLTLLYCPKWKSRRKSVSKTSFSYQHSAQKATNFVHHQGHQTRQSYLFHGKFFLK